VYLDRDFTATSDTGGVGAAAFPELAPADLVLDPQATDLALGTQLAVQIFVPGYTIWFDVSTFRPVALGDAMPRWGGIHKVDVPPKRVLAVRTIESLRQVTARWGALSGPATLAGLDAAPIGDSVDLRNIIIDTIEGDPFDVGVPWQDTPATHGATLAWWGDADQAKTLKGRELAFLPANTAPYTAVVTDVQVAQPADLSIVFLDREVAYADFPTADPTTNVLGNLVGATQGEPQAEAVLGNGDDQLTFQTFKLPKDPLTHLSHPELTPPLRPEITIVVGDRIWTYVATLYGQPPEAEVYTVRRDNTATSWVQFGDGKTGARLPSGVDNVRVRWRTGIAAFGALKPGASPSLVTRIDAVKQVDLPKPVIGGAAPETMDVARVAAPARVQSLDRLVSLADVEAETLALAGVERARATWSIAGGVPCITVTVLMQEQRAADVEAVRDSLATANRRRGPSRFPIVVVEGASEYIYLSATITSDPARDVAAIRRDVDAALDALFDTHSFGGAEYATRIEGALQNVDGVRWVIIDALGSLGTADDPGTLVYPSVPSRAEVVPCPSDHVLHIHHPAGSDLVRVQIVPQGGDA
jgi:hypothetical protein